MCPGFDTKQSDGEVQVMLELLGIRSTSSLPMLPGSLYSRSGSAMGQIELNCVLMLNWIAWNRTVLIFKLCTYAKNELFEIKLLLTFKLCTYAKLNWFEIEQFWHLTVYKQKTILILNIIDWYRTVCVYKNVFGIK